MYSRSTLKPSTFCVELRPAPRNELGVAVAANVRRVQVDQVLERQAAVDEVFDLLDADLSMYRRTRVPWFAISSIILRLVC